MTGRTKAVLGIGGAALVAVVVVVTTPRADGPTTTYEKTPTQPATSQPTTPPLGDVLGEEVEPDMELIPTNASSDAETIPIQPELPPEVTVVPDTGEPGSAVPYDCNTGKLCSDVQSCEEAEFYLNVCGESLFDEDGDGVPCETLCQ